MLIAKIDFCVNRDQFKRDCAEAFDSIEKWKRDGMYQPPNTKLTGSVVERKERTGETIRNSISFMEIIMGARSRSS